MTLFHGLPSDRVHAIAQDADGAMWFGTEAGLAKFDGRRTQAVIDSDLPPGRVLALQTDSEGTLWIGTDNGAARLINGRFLGIRDLAGKTINAIITPDKGRAILATEQGMIYECRVKPAASASEVAGSRPRPDDGVVVRPLLNEPAPSADADHPGLLPITSLVIAHDRLLAGSLSRGVMLIENGMARPLEMRPQAYFVRALATDARGNLWAGTKARKDESGFYEGGDKPPIARVDAPTGPVTALRSGAHDDMWVGSDGRGVFHLAGPKNVVHFTFDGTLGGLRSDHVYAIFVDREEVVWFGTDRGVSRYDPSAPRVEAVSESGESNFVRALFQTANGQLLCGTNRGLFVYDEARKAWHSVNSLSRSVIYSISEDKGGRLFIGAASGFYIGPRSSRNERLENQTFAHIESGSGAVDAPGSVRSTAEFKGNLYIANFGRGVERVEEGRAHLIWPNVTGGTPEVLSLFADGNNRLLIGTTNGLVVYDGQSSKTDPGFDIFKGATIRSIDRAGDGSLWFATNRGVYSCAPNGTCVPAASLVDARYVITNKSSSVNEAWCATTGGGLLKILFDQQLGPIVSQIDAEQGLPSQNVFAVLPERDAEGSEVLLIGTNRGVVRYRPGRFSPSLSPARIISKRVHQPDELISGLNLEYPQNSLLLDVNAISSRTFPDQFQYAFVLTDTKGKVVKQKLSRDSQFTMEGLKPGKYLVTARAFTKDLVASKPLAFELNVAGAPFPWTSTALAVLLALALLALLWAILERRRIVRTSAALADANRELAGARLDLANEAERERRRIARDLHDQTLADLRQLLLVADRIPAGEVDGNGSGSEQVVVDEQAVFDRAGFRKEIESVSNEIRRICEDLSPSVLDNVGLAAALEWALANAVAHLPAERKFEYEVVAGEEIEERLNLEAGVRIQIYRIAQEVINNICRHSIAKRVWLSLKACGEEGLELNIADDGEFFAPAEARLQGRGLTNIQARASLIDAEIAWSEREAGGTLFRLRKVR